ncbi:MAG: MGMT family protein [Ilumatobacteraceae bacterium]
MTRPDDVRQSRAASAARRDRRFAEVMLALGEGEVVSYGDVAEVAGFPKLSRAVGRFLATTELDVPWWRVVNTAGRLVPGHEREQAAILRSEGVVVRSGRVVEAPVGRFSR